MTALDLVYLAANAAVALYLWKRVGMQFGCTMLLLSALLLIYGPAHVAFQYERDLNADLQPTITLALLLMWGCLLLGIELPALLWPRRSRRLRRTAARWDALPLRDEYRPGALFRPFAALVLLILAVDLVAENHLGKIAAYYASGGLLEDLLLFRQEEGGSALYLVNVLTLTVAPFITMVLLCDAVRLGTTRARAIFIAAVAIVLLAKLATLQKSPAAVYLLQLLLAWWLTRSNRPRLRTLLLAAALFFAAMVPLSLAAFPGIELGDLLGYFYRRVLEAPHETLEDYFVVYPGQIDFLHGLGFRWLHALVGEGEYLGSSLVVATQHDSEGASFNALFIADSWADFGYAGVALAAFALGVTVRAVDAFCFCLGKSNASIAVLASMLFAVIYVVSASFSAALVTGGLALVPLVAWLLGRPLVARSKRRAAAPALSH